MLKYYASALMAGFLLDLLIGDPRWLYHPVIFIGKTISFFERNIRRRFPATPHGELAGGVLLVLLTLVVSGGIPVVILAVTGRIHPLLQWAAGAFLCYQLLAMKCLKDESMKVYHALKTGTLEDGRHAVSMIVGRDTQALDEKGVIKAAVETVAENFSDGVLAPMFYMVIGGPVLMFLYKGINTMDSMVGYKNDRYLYFGRCAARLDDAANFIPSRLAGIMLILAAYLGNFSGKDAKRIFLRDRKKHASPNSAQTESAAAGALQIQLAGNAYYFGKLHEKQFVGDPIREIQVEDIRRMNKLMYLASIMSAVLFTAAGLMVAYMI
ncbi:MAG: adenosylcobinamide-phosphate synthase CbiB [Anaerovoracaceae bacterium]|nr:adenosylcobinamide-phosphate synthase CbiB [Anaerovoracaceae bacterium]